MRSIFLAALLLIGCSPLGENKQPHRYFVLEPAGVKSSPLAVRVGTATAATFYDNESIAYSRAPGTRGYYQLNSWTEVPVRRIADLLTARSNGAGPVLNLHLVEMYHDAAASPGSVRVVLSAEIGGKRKTFETAAPAASFDAQGAVRGFNAAVGKMLEELEAWAAGT
jgi:cholesterol transport system auxiliary component